MGKTALKTFVCSFTFSLFAILGANKEFFGVSCPSQPEIKIPEKNISLFFKDMSPSSPAHKTIPIKKIALNIPQLKQEDKINIASIEDSIPLTFAGNDIEFDEEIPLQTAQSAKETIIAEQETVSPPAPEPEPPTGDPEEALPNVYERSEVDDFIPFTSKTVQAKVQIIRPNEKRLKKSSVSSSPEAQESVLAYSETTAQEAERRNTPEEVIPLETEQKPFVIAQTPDPESEDDASSQEEEDISSLPPTFKIARAAVNPDTIPTTAPAQAPVSAGEPENLLIPLQKDNNSPSASTDTKVASAPTDSQLAMLTGKESIHSMGKAPSADNSALSQEAKWETMAQKNNEGSAWIAAKGAGHQRNKQLAKEAFFQNAENEIIKETLDARNKLSNAEDVKVAAQMVKNLIIPIPEDILNDPNLTPQLVATDQEDEDNQADNTPLPTPKAPEVTPVPASKEDNSLLKSITSIFNKATDKSPDDGNDDEEAPGIIKRIIKGKNKAKKNNSAENKILPTEIRLAFQPNRAEISGVTLKWLQAFANKTNEDANIGLEIRIDGSSPQQLQQKRLNLIYNILINDGVDYRKINTVFTSREPNSFVIRTIRLNSNSNGGIKEDNEWQDYYKAW